MKGAGLLLCVVALLATTGESLARCNGLADFLLCEDFDQYCTGAPPWPARCVYGQSIDNDAFWEHWSWDACGDKRMTIQDDVKEGTTEPLYADSPPYTARYYGSEQDMNWYNPTYNTRDLLAEITAKDPNMTAVIGTDDNPLNLAFKYHFKGRNIPGTGGGMEYYQNCYIELSMNEDRAPTDFVRSEDCSLEYGCGSSHGFPIICQQNNPGAQSRGCPLLSTAEHASIAVGVLAYLDVNPCHCGEDVAHAASNWHLVFFDGLKWWTLKSNVPSSEGGGELTPLDGAPMPPPSDINKSPGDFGVFNKVNEVRLTIKSTTVKVELEYVMRSGINNQKYLIYHWQEIPRQYEGPFNKISIGAGQGREWDPAAGGWTPEGERCLWANAQGGNHDLDSFLLYGGQLVREEGACCLPAGGCGPRSASECQAVGGSYYGDGTTCADPQVQCCNDPAPDYDGDQDVDMVDFGQLQRCLLIASEGQAIVEGCQCFDLDHNLTLDAGDVERFVLCGSGAGVSAAADCDGDN